MIETSALKARPGNDAGVRAPLRVGVLGVGRIGSMHAELLARRVPGATLAAVYDVDAGRAGEVAAKLQTPAASSTEELMSSGDVDAVAICSNTTTHAELIAAAAQRRKAIFCEKPVSLDLAEVDRAVDAVDGAGVPFQIGFNRRFDPAHQSVRDAVADGTIGDVHLVRISSRDPVPPSLGYLKGSGGIFLDMTIHDFDMARYVVGSEVVEVYAQGAVRLDPAIAEAGDVDTALITLVHENGSLTAIDNSRQAVYGYDQRVEAFGSAGMAASENPLAHSALLRTADGTRTPPLPHFFLERYTPSYVREWEAFVAAVTNGRTPPVGTVDARAPLVIGLAAWRSLRERRPVRIEEVDPA